MLTLLHADGFIEIFADKNVDVKIVHVPAGDEIAAEAYIEATIPRCYAEIYYPTAKRATELLTPTTPEDIEYRRWSVDLLHQIQDVGRDA